MNCRQFQDSMYDYVDGSLPADVKAAAQAHLGGCLPCRERLCKEQKLNEMMSVGLQQGASSLTLRPEIRNRIVAATLREPASPFARRSIFEWWKHFALPAAAGAALILVGTFLLIAHFSRGNKPGMATAEATAGGPPPPLSIQMSVLAPACVFRRDGDTVIDTISEQSVSVSETVWPSSSQPIQTKSTL